MPELGRIRDTGSNTLEVTSDCACLKTLEGAILGYNRHLASSENG